MTPSDLFSLLALLVYILASAFSIVALLGRSQRFNRLAVMLILVAFSLHTLLMLLGAISSGPAETSRSFYLIPLAWCLMAVFLIMWWKLKMNMLLLFASPMAFVLLFVSLIMHGASTTLSTSFTGPIFSLHILGVFTGIGLMAVAAGAGLFFLWQEKSIKTKTPMTGFRKDLPALMSLDRLNALTTVIGFPAYSLGVLCGFVWARTAWGVGLSGDPKELFSLFIWVLYALLFHQRQAHGWRGRKPALMGIFIFLASLFSLFFVNTLFSTHHSFEANF